ncbi:MAG: N-acetylneuraminate synthase family protein [Candidatus Omnitrophica bacterium]|nr:N-acetylneuraminate synthase family protein [Candidatus Omnitrophota bacterium]
MEEEIKINGGYIGGDNPIYIIAEIGRTYNSDLKTAKRMMKEIANAGGDAVKIQSIEAEELLVKNNHTKNHYKELEGLERSLEDHRYLKEVAERYGIDFLSTPESLNMVDLLEKAGVKVYKLASLDLVHYGLLKYIARKQKPMFLSTGMANMNEIQDALNIIRSAGNNKIVLLYCASLYPTEPEEMDLKTIRTFKETFKVIPGFSDHTLGISAAIASAALGAKVIEKHFTLDRNQPGNDHKISIEPKELNKMVKEIRKIEKMLGSGNKVLSGREIALRNVKRRKIVAARDLEKGTRLKKDLLNFKQLDSPEGIQSQHGNEVIGKIIKTNLKKDEPLSWDTLQGCE